MLDIALLNFIGAGLTSCAPVHSLKAPDRAMMYGVTLARVLHQYDQFKTHEFVESTIRSIWSDWQASQLPAEVAEKHLAGLPEILRDAQPEKDTLVTAFAIAGAKTKLGDAAIAGQSRRLATEVVERARELDLFAKTGLSDTIAFFFLESLYSKLLASKAYLDAMQPRLESYCDKQLWDYIPVITESALDAERESVRKKQAEIAPIQSADADANDDDTSEKPAGTYLTRLRASLKLINEGETASSKDEDLPLKTA